MGAINREWHAANRMPAHPSRHERAQWHFEHANACGCRTPSPAERALIDEYAAASATAPVLGEPPEAVQ
ncbi:hypothetical protein [Demequina sp.]|uniref:hypothetical protein n=1 Tax=Demequina sp. TaxID=2050685 RepID=UPI003D11A550